MRDDNGGTDVKLAYPDKFLHGVTRHASYSVMKIPAGPIIAFGTEAQNHIEQLSIGRFSSSEPERANG